MKTKARHCEDCAGKSQCRRYYWIKGTEPCPLWHPDGTLEIRGALEEPLPVQEPTE